MARKTMETRNLPVDLTDEQVESRSRLLARGHLDLLKDEEAAEREAADHKAAIKADKERLKRRRGELDALARAVATRKITMDVDCDWHYVLGTEEAKGVKILVRRDTGQAIERRPITAEERQLVIGERLEEANEEQLKLWEEQLAAASSAVEMEEEAEEGEEDLDDDEAED